MTARNTVGVVDKVSGVSTPITGTTDTRMTLASFFRRFSVSRAKSGILYGPSGGNLNVTGTTSFAYLVEAGAAAIAPDSSSGVYVVMNDAQVSVSTSAAPGTGSRIDIIYIVQADAWDRSAAATAATVGVAVGTSTTGTPTAPAIPDGALEIARNTMTSAATTTASSGNTITQTGPYTTTMGGVIFYRTATEQSSDTGAAESNLSYRNDQNRLQVSDGTNHIPLAFSKEGIPVFSSSTTRNTWATYVGLSDGLKVYRSDTLIVERYSAALAAWREWESDWISYSPTVSNISFGSGGTNTWKYRWEQGTVHVIGAMKLGTSGTMGTAPTFTLPLNSAALAHNNVRFAGDVKLYDDSATGQYIGIVIANGASVTTALIQAHSGTATLNGSITATTPFGVAWAVSDAIDIDIHYETV